MKNLFVLASFLLIIIPGCVNITQPPPSQPVAPPVIVTFSASPTGVKSGESATLLWNVTGATSVTIDQGVDKVAAAGTKAVSPTKTTIYTLTATNSAGTNTQSVTLTVGGLSILPGLREKPHIPPITLTETVFDFINEAPSASWQDAKGPVKFADNDIYSTVQYHYDTVWKEITNPKTLSIFFIAVTLYRVPILN